MKKRYLLVIFLFLLFIPILNAADQYEDDDIAADAKYITADGIPQTHNFSPSGDIDWIKFNATAGFTYVIETLNLSDIDISDTIIELYYTDASTKLAENDDILLGIVRISKIMWKAPANGTYYIKATEWSNQQGNYNISVTQKGVLIPYLISHSSDFNITKGRFFNFSTGVSCIGGPCGEVKATLDPQNSKINQKLLEEVRKKGKIDVIVKLKKQSVGKFRKSKREDVVNSLSSFKLKRNLDLTDSFSGKINEQDLLRLFENEDIEDIKLDKEYRIMLTESLGIMNIPILHNTSVDGVMINGTGQTICILDTGINYSHSDFGSCAKTDNINDGSCERVIGGYDFVNDDDDPYDDNGHGTHVAGIAASSDQFYKGVAPGAKIIALKVLNSAGSGSGADIAAGIQWCISNASKFNITVITMSIGSTTCHETASLGCEDDSLADYINLARANNITVTVASGNEDFGDGISMQGLSSPACVKNSTAIGSTTKADAIASYTNRNLLLDLLATGSGIAAGRWNLASCLSGCSCSSNRMSCSGTSMATPHVAGAVALLQQYSKLKYDRILIPAEIEHILKSNGANILDSSGTKYDFTRINVNYAATSKGDVSTVIGDEPFYTTSANPHDASCLDMSAGDSCNQTWEVNASGTGRYEFFTIYETDYYAYNITSKINVSIITQQIPVITLTAIPSFNVVIGNQSIVSCDSSQVNVSLYRNGTLVSNPDIQNLSLGNYNYSCNSSETDYYLKGFISEILTVSEVNAPNITISSPLNSTVYNYSYQLLLNFTTDGICNCSYSLDDEEGIYFPSLSTSFSTNLNIYNNSLHILIINCTNGNNKSKGEAVYFTVNDTSAPDILSSGPSGTDSDGAVSLTVALDEPAECRYSASDENYSQMTNKLALDFGLTYKKDLSLSDGSYSYYIRCNDSLGNVMNSSETITFSVDSSNNNGGGGGGGGGSSGGSSSASTTNTEEEEKCIEDWSCDKWGECINGKQTRECGDWNNCGTSENKPATEQGCGMVSSENLAEEETIKEINEITGQAVQEEEDKNYFGYITSFIVKEMKPGERGFEVMVFVLVFVVIALMILFFYIKIIKDEFI